MKQVNLLVMSLLPFISLAQNETVFDILSKRLYNYYATAPPEKIYVHQDRTQYLSGETIWFKAYQSVYPSSSDMSKVVYIELIDGMNSPVIKTQWKLENGYASGQMELPDSLQSGIYQLRAYTRWMQNFDTDNFFMRDIQITSLKKEMKDIFTEFNISDTLLSAVVRIPDTLKKYYTYRLRLNGEDTEKFSFELDRNGEAILDIDLPGEILLEGTQFFIMETEGGDMEFPIPQTPLINLSLFPEGGNLVGGLPSKVAFKVSDRKGRGFEATGRILDEMGNEVRRFHTQYNGYGQFSFIPEKNKKYTAILDNYPVEVSLPEIYATGLVMNSSLRSDRLRLTIWHNMDTDTQLPLYLTIHQEGSAWFNTHVDISKQMSVIDIPYDKLPTGIFTITLFDANYTAYAERLAFCNYPDILALTMKTDKASYNIRDRVTVNLTNPEQKSGNFSVSVIKTNFDNVEMRDNYYSNFFLTSELKGYIENPALYFNRQDSTSIQKLDLLMLTHGWRRYGWDDLTSEKYPEITYYMEGGLGFSGKVYPENERQKPENIEVTAVFRHDEISDIIPFNPAPDGSFMFTDYNFTDTAEVILSALYRQRTLNISASEHGRPKSDFYEFGKSISDVNQSLYIDLYGSINQISGEGLENKIHELPEVSIIAQKPEKRRFEYRIHNNEFISKIYSAQENYSYEISGDDGYGSLGAIGILYHTPGVIVRKGGSEIKVSGTGGHISSSTTNSMARTVDPIYLLDGTQTSYGNLRSMSPKLIDRVEVLNAASAMMYSSGAWGGAIAFYTKDWDGMVYSTPSKTVSYKFAGYNQQKEFYSPDYTTIKDGTVDYRNTLYWKPDIIIGEDGKAEFSFFTSDDKAEYLIQCEGRSEDGIIGVTNIWFKTEL